MAGPGKRPRVDEDGGAPSGWARLPLLLPEDWEPRRRSAALALAACSAEGAADVVRWAQRFLFPAGPAARRSSGDEEEDVDEDARTMTPASSSSSSNSSSSSSSSSEEDEEEEEEESSSPSPEASGADSDCVLIESGDEGAAPAGRGAVPPGGEEGGAAGGDGGEEDLMICGDKPGMLHFAPHSRSDCPTHPFTRGRPAEPPPASNVLFCPFCYCFVCNAPVKECSSWGQHCQADPKSAEAKAARSARSLRKHMALQVRAAPFRERGEGESRGGGPVPYSTQA